MAVPSAGCHSKALITNIQGFSTEDGPGIRTTIFFKGCPLSCPWCHNPEGMAAKQELIFHPDKCIGCKECKKVCSNGAPLPGMAEFKKCVACFRCAEACPPMARKVMGEWITASELAEQVLRDRVYYETSGGGVTASGGEAMLWAEFVTELFKLLQEEKIHTALDTSGVIGGDKLAAALAHSDLALVDLKIMDPDKHQEIIGVPLPPILEHIREIDASGTPIWIRTPIVPGYTDDPENLSAIAEFAASLQNLEQVDLLPYHRMAEAKYRQLGLVYKLDSVQPPNDEAMEQAARPFTDLGLKAVIAGKD